MTPEEIVQELRRQGYSISGKTLTPPAQTPGTMTEQAIAGLRAIGYGIDTASKTITPPAPRASNAATREYWALRRAYRARAMVSE